MSIFMLQFDVISISVSTGRNSYEGDTEPVQFLVKATEPMARFLAEWSQWMGRHVHELEFCYQLGERGQWVPIDGDQTVGAQSISCIRVNPAGPKKFANAVAPPPPGSMPPPPPPPPPPAPPPPLRDPNTLIVRVADTTGDETYFKLKKSTKLDKYVSPE
jgi:hypothetical protein